MTDTIQRYREFVERKQSLTKGVGFESGPVNDVLFDYQGRIVQWALKRGRAAIFAGTGLGKTLMQCEINRHIPGRRLILCPLAVAPQTVKEARMVGLDVSREPIGDSGVQIVNYDRLDSVIHERWDAVTLDESSIIKSQDGATRNTILSAFSRVPYRFAFTATPSPNDWTELGNHAQFLGVATHQEMLATYFMHDGGDTSKWRLKRHAQRDFWKWVGSWAACFTSPAELGFDGSRHQLPPLEVVNHTIDVNYNPGGALFGGDVAATSLHDVLRETVSERVQLASQLAQAGKGPCIIWCNGNDEQDQITKAIPGAVSVTGSMPSDTKERLLSGFSGGEFDVLVTKPSIAGFGMNWQHCDRMIFASLTFSYEMFHQAVRRCYRFGQKNPVTVHVISTSADSSVRDIINYKAEAFRTMSESMALWNSQEIRA